MKLDMIPSVSSLHCVVVCGGLLNEWARCEPLASTTGGSLLPYLCQRLWHRWCWPVPAVCPPQPLRSHTVCLFHPTALASVPRQAPHPHIKSVTAETPNVFLVNCCTVARHCGVVKMFPLTVSRCCLWTPALTIPFKAQTWPGHQLLQSCAGPQNSCFDRPRQNILTKLCLFMIELWPSYLEVLTTRSGARQTVPGQRLDGHWSAARA